MHQKLACFFFFSIPVLRYSSMHLNIIYKSIATMALGQVVSYRVLVFTCTVCTVGTVVPPVCTRIIIQCASPDDITHMGEREDTVWGYKLMITKNIQPVVTWYLIKHCKIIHTHHVEISVLVVGPLLNYYDIVLGSWSDNTLRGSQYHTKLHHREDLQYPNQLVGLLSPIYVVSEYYGASPFLNRSSASPGAFRALLHRMQI